MHTHTRGNSLMCAIIGVRTVCRNKLYVIHYKALKVIFRKSNKELVIYATCDLHEEKEREGGLLNDFQDLGRL